MFTDLQVVQSKRCPCTFLLLPLDSLIFQHFRSDFSPCGAAHSFPVFSFLDLSTRVLKHLIFLSFPFHTASYFPYFHGSLHPTPPPPPHPAVVHLLTISSLKTHPVWCKVSPFYLPHLPPSFSPLPPPPPLLDCLDRSKWCDCDCSAGRLPLSAFGKSDVSRGRGRREKAEREREREKGGMFS